MTPPDFSELISILETTGIVSHPQWTKLKKSIRDIEQAYDEQLRRNTITHHQARNFLNKFGLGEMDIETIVDWFLDLPKLKAEYKPPHSEPDGYASPQTARLASYANATFHLVRALNELVTINNEG